MGRGVIFDLVGAQSPSYWGRGIARYSIELVQAMAKIHPELVSAVVLHPGLPTPDGLDGLEPLLTSEPDWRSASVLHLSSVFELEVPVRTFWPREAAANRLYTAVTLYDLIPDVFPGWYLEDPGLRRRWRCCREVVRAADAVLTLSESARQDAIGMLGLPEQRVAVIGSGTSPVFRPPESRQAAFQLAKKWVAQEGVGELEEGFVIYNGAFNRHKNVDGLVEGYASMSPELTARHQLVIVCHAPPLTRNHYLVMAKELGLEGRVLVTGFVPEEVLVSLHQSADLGVFPSMYEGYGLPVIESMGCGTPNIVADNSSLRELLPREARFEPEDPFAIGTAISRALTDRAFRKRLIALATREPPSWAAVADKAAAVFDELCGRSPERRPGWRRRPQLALIDIPHELALALAPFASCDGVTILDGTDTAARPPKRQESETAGPETRGPETAAPETAAPETAGPETAAPETAAPETGAPETMLLSWPSLPRADAWRGGYDAAVAWADGLDEQAMVRMDQLAEQWRGRRIAVVRPGLATADNDAAVSRLEAAGFLVVDAQDGWDATARNVVEGARGLPSPSLADV
jgi:glycosyltransferase involved in cell wall biosynthesis